MKRIPRRKKTVSSASTPVETPTATQTPEPASQTDSDKVIPSETNVDKGQLHEFDDTNGTNHAVSAIKGTKDNENQKQLGLESPPSTQTLNFTKDTQNDNDDNETRDFLNPFAISSSPQSQSQPQSHSQSQTRSKISPPSSISIPINAPLKSNIGIEKETRSKTQDDSIDIDNDTIESITFSNSDTKEKTSSTSISFSNLKRNPIQKQKQKRTKISIPAPTQIQIPTPSSTPTSIPKSPVSQELTESKINTLKDTKCLQRQPPKKQTKKVVNDKRKTKKPKVTSTTSNTLEKEYKNTKDSEENSENIEVFKSINNNNNRRRITRSSTINSEVDLTDISQSSASSDKTKRFKKSKYNWACTKTIKKNEIQEDGKEKEVLVRVPVDMVAKVDSETQKIVFIPFEVLEGDIENDEEVEKENENEDDSNKIEGKGKQKEEEEDHDAQKIEEKLKLKKLKRLQELRNNEKIVINNISKQLTNSKKLISKDVNILKNAIIDESTITISDLCSSSLPFGETSDKIDDVLAAQKKIKLAKEEMKLKKKNIKDRFRERISRNDNDSNDEGEFDQVKEDELELNELMAEDDDKDLQDLKLKQEEAKKELLDLEEQEKMSNNGATLQLTLENGQLVVQADSLLINRHENIDMNREKEKQNPFENPINNATYGKKSNKKTYKWENDELIRFYDALSSWGTDFNLISQLFPYRTRRQIKSKFLLEEKKNPHLIELALKRKLGSNINEIKKSLARPMKLVEDIEKELEEVRQKYSEDMKKEQESIEQAKKEDREIQDKKEIDRINGTTSVRGRGSRVQYVNHFREGETIVGTGDDIKKKRAEIERQMLERE